MRDLFAGAHDRLATPFDIKIDLHADQIGGARFRHSDLQAPLFDADLIRDVERAQQIFVSERGVLDRLFELRVVAD